MIINATKLPIPIAAIQWTGDNLSEVLEFTGKHPKFDEWFPGGFEEYAAFVKNDGNIFKIITNHGNVKANPTDWVLRSPSGEHYPITDELFKQTYKVVDPMKEEIIDATNRLIGLVRDLPPTRQHSLAVTNLEQAKHWLQD